MLKIQMNAAILMMAFKSMKVKLETKLSLMDGELQLLIQLVLESKSKCEFKGEYCESNRSKYKKK